MRISKVRDYISQQILDQDAKFKEWKDGFSFENIPRNIFDKAFHVTYNVPSIERNDSYNLHNVSASVKLFYKGYRNPQEALDSAMDLSNLIGLNIQSTTAMNLFRSTDSFPIQNIEFVSQNAEPLESNDNAMIITLELNLTVIQTIC